MPSTFPCPNPACTQVFSPQDVRGAASLTCPKCGQVFRFAPRAAAPAPPPRKVERAAPPAPTEPARVIDPPPAARRKTRRPSRRRWVWPVVVGAILLLGGAGVWTFRDRWRSPEVAESLPPVESRPLNFRFRPPGEPWQQDKAVERDLGASLAMRRHDPNSWFALVAHNYRDKLPREDELLREAVNRLERLFKKGVEWEHRDEDAFAGLTAQRFVFTAENNNVAVSGECLLMASGGIGYWFLAWTAASDGPDVPDDVKQEWRTIRDGFTLLKEREGWTGKVPEIVEAQGGRAGYRLKYTKGLWEKDDKPLDADLLLLGRDPEAPQDARKWAWVRTFVRPSDGDPESALKAALAFVEEREKKLYKEVKLEPVPEAAKGGLADGPLMLGQAPARAVRLRVKKGDDYEQFFAVAAVPRPAYTLVLVGECTWPHRAVWEDRFGPVLHSLHFDKK